jgi:hypothetical protein
MHLLRKLFERNEKHLSELRRRTGSSAVAENAVILSEVACRAVALCEGWEGSRCESLKVTSSEALDFARDDGK